ncbi:MAG: toprim domain-containing protein [Deltaproteobacteria bacterium]|jgi:DNA primase|nr:toprim domain-containing protein [Deltaproteobacteria bacterium]
MKTAQEFYVANLRTKEGQAAYAYLLDRGVSKDSINSFGLGLALPEWDRLARYMEAKRFGKPLLLEAGLIRRAKTGDKYYDNFRNRITFPIHDSFPRVLGFAARTYVPGDEGAKYVNSPTTPIYEKGRQLYGFHLARPHIKSGGVAFVVEGYLDAITLHAGGVKAAVAAMGTALTQTQVNSLKGTAKEVQLVFDADQAGIEASKRALPLLYNADLDGRVISLPAGHDPDSFVREYGSQAFYDLADKAPDLADYFIARLLDTNAKTMTGQGRIVSEMKEVLRQVPDAVKGQFLRNKLADRLGLSPELLTLREAEKFKRPPAAANKPKPADDYDRAAGELLVFMMVHRECLSLVDDWLISVWPEDRTKIVLKGVAKALKDNPDNPDVRPQGLGLDGDDHQMSALVSRAALSNRTYPADQTMAKAKAMIVKLRDRGKKKKDEEFTKAIKLAEAMGDEETVEKLLAAKRGQIDPAIPVGPR